MTSPAIAFEAWLVDASVALKWFLPLDREPDGDLARTVIGSLAMRTTSLAFYEVGNVLARRSGLAAVQIGAALGLFEDICGEPIELTSADRHSAAVLAHEHQLTFYDASYAAIARRTGRGLLSADRDLLDPKLAVSLEDVLKQV
ncbi:MAG: type II toxin-antitoxin system VapC family toxin [Solirubrobacteraceae bacterium]